MKRYAHAEGVFPEWEGIGKGGEKAVPMDAIMKAVHIPETEIPILLAEQEAFEQEAALFQLPYLFVSLVRIVNATKTD